jgi:tetratricopeptide (TPR) repeat protein
MVYLQPILILDHGLFSILLDMLQTRRVYLFFLILSSTWPGSVNPRPLPLACTKLSLLTTYSAALESFISKDYIKSTRYYEDVLKCDSKFTAAYVGLGRNYQELGIKEKSLQAYNTAIKFDQSNPIVYSNRGLVKASLGRLDEASTDFNQSIKLEQNNPIALTNRGVAFATQGKLQLANSDFDKALSANSAYGEAYINRGIVHELLGNIKAACRDWKRAIALRQFSARSWVATQCTN